MNHSKGRIDSKKRQSTVNLLEFYDAIKYDDLFEGNDSRERIISFSFLIRKLKAIRKLIS